MAGPADKQVQQAFEAWLRDHGWKILEERSTRECVDIEAWHRDGARLLAEVDAAVGGGRDVDAVYGRLLRRMLDVPGIRYAIVVCDSAMNEALRVPARVREALSVDVYVVGADRGVRRVDA